MITVLYCMVGTHIPPLGYLNGIQLTYVCLRVEKAEMEN